MNVLAKIVIPRTNVTSKYILNELEEMAREEFFRLKKVIEIERKMFGDKHDKKKKEEEPIMCTTCKPTPKFSVIERCLMCDALLIPAEQKPEKESEEKLDEFKAYLNEIVNITKDLDEQGFIAASVEEFIKTAEELKFKLEYNTERTKSLEEEKKPYYEQLNHLCENCKKKYLKEKAAKLKEDEPESEIIEPEPIVPLSLQEPQPVVPLPPLPLPPPRQPPQVPSVVYETPDLELGTFETDIKEITKVIRVKKEDGSISEEKTVVKVKRVVSTPIKAVPQPNPVNHDRAGRIIFQPSEISGSSSKSNPYSGSRTVGVVTRKSLDRFPCYSKFDVIQGRVQSAILNSSSPMSDPVVRYCMSSVTLLSVDFGEYSSSCVYSCIDYE